MNKEQTSGRNAVKHTPGPWHTENHAGRVIICDNSSLPIAGVHFKDSHARQDANAALIEAAPEMLEALKKLVAISDKGLSSVSNFETAWGEARAAIAKATGAA